MIDSSERWQHWVDTFIDGSRNDNVAVFSSFLTFHLQLDVIITWRQITFHW